MSFVQSNGRQPKVLVMTGATGGIGRRALELLHARTPEWRVLLLARPSARLDSLSRAWPRERLTIVPVELGSLSSVDLAAKRAETLLAGTPIDALALNAGTQPIVGDRSSVDGFELCFAVNHLAHFLLADRLTPLIRTGGRVVVTSSVVHDPAAFCLVGITRAQWEDPMNLADPALAQGQVPAGVNRGEARYSASKLLNLLHARYLAASVPRLTTVAFNPSVVPGTEIARERNNLQKLAWKYVLPLLAPIIPGLRSLERSAGDLVWLIAEADLTGRSGMYFDGREVAPGSVESRDQAKIARMAEASRHLIAEKLNQKSRIPRVTAA